MARSVLIIDDDIEVIDITSRHLAPLGIRVDSAPDGDIGLDRARTGNYQLIILDVTMPGLDGLAVCRALRAGNQHTPILFLSGRADIIDKVLGFEMGGDDYLSKPFHIRELIARVEALLRRASKPKELTSADTLSFDGLLIDRRRMIVERDGQRIDLSATEFRLLEFLALHAGQPLTRDQLRAGVWGYDCQQFDQTVTTALARLRSKIEPNPAEPYYILTVRGVGYRFAE